MKSEVQSITILGATGSIGDSTIDVVLRHPERYRVFALTAKSNLAKLIELAKKCRPQFLVCADDKDFAQLQSLAREAGLDCKVEAGEKALLAVASHPDVDTVMAAIVGAAGLLPTYQAVCSGKRVLLANKEALVMSGQIFMDAVDKHGAQLLPVDSEHNAIFQCLPNTYSKSGISSILLTGSGGPFLNHDLSTFSGITPEQACKHPNWSMGQKISVDSATMMNKGLEFIEAKWLFSGYCESIQVVIHPQSIIHSMVQYKDGSVLAQMGRPDMRTPIAHVLAYPERIESGVQPLDFSAINDLTFQSPDFNRFPCLKLAMEAADHGQTYTTTLNAANEIAVSAFLDNLISFTDISRLCQKSLEHLQSASVRSIDEVIELDKEVRARTQQSIRELQPC